jgi:YHS domain-containing protein
MLRREMLVGYTLAGFLAILVPVSFWNDVFFRGHGYATTLENVVVGPFIALISCVCSIGNVPLAAALWKGGISFGGVVSFIFADLIALPLLLVYRKLFGIKMMFRMLGVFWVVMSIAGLLIQGIFRAASLIPTAHRANIVSERFTFGPTTILDAIFLVVIVYMYVLARRQHQSGDSDTYSTDPVCGMRIASASAPASITYEGTTISFCSQHCCDRFVSDPARFGFPEGIAERLLPDATESP